MFDKLELFPQRASEFASQVDQVYLYLVVVSVVFVGGIVAAILLFSVLYRRRPGHRAKPERTITSLEVTWTVVPLGLVLVAFAWAAKVYFDVLRPPAEAMQFLVTGKQWMWKLQHPTGQREINELHVPVGAAVELTMTSEDVIHSFYVPAFRTKRDVVPGRYSRIWFVADRVGSYHLFCAEYCGTKHSEMIGRVVVMEPEEYQRWLAGIPVESTPVESGERLFQNLRCDTCHAAGSGQRGPDLAGRWGAVVPLEGGGTAVFDADHVRESILRPRAKLTAGYRPLMPTYEGQVDEAQILHLVAYIRSLTEDGSGAQDE